MEEMRQLKANKIKEKGSQHDPERVANKEETLMDGGLYNTKQCFTRWLMSQHC